LFLATTKTAPLAVSAIVYYNNTLRQKQHFHKLKSLVQKGVSSKLCKNTKIHKGSLGYIKI
jgi:hypothetical protein